MSTQGISIAAKLKKIREAYVKQLPVQLDGIREALKAFMQKPSGGAELELLHRCIHTMKGASASFGLSRLSVVAAAGEQMTKEAMQAENPPDWAWINRMQEQFTLMKSEAAAIEAEQVTDLQALDLVAASENSMAREHKFVYLCEADSYQRMSLAAQIGCFGFQVTAFGDLQQLGNAVKNSAPDVIVMDQMFLGQSLGGAGVIAKIQSERKTAIPIVFISSQDEFSCRLAAVQSGSSAFFVKPVNATDLCATLCSLTTVEKPEPYRIMIVDDDPHLSELYSTILQGADMVTMELNDPLQVVSHISEFKPDLIMTDMNMPGCNGMDLAKTIRQAGATFSIPIIFLSSETDTDKQFHAMQMGGDEFLTKPIKPEHLISAVTMRAERMKIIRSFMIRDATTGLFNHCALKERLNMTIDKALSNESDVCFAMIDVDGFRQVNDSYGYPTGDRVLITLASFLRQRLRKGDIIGRYGGNEFAVILTECDIAMAVKLLDELRENFAAICFPAGGESFSSSFSCGIAPLSGFGDADQLCKAADAALYQAKNGGRNRVVTADVGK